MALHSIPDPSSIMNPVFLHKSCDPFDPRENPCEIGAHVQYAVNVTSIDHVLKTIHFVKKHNIRFVVKSSGHECASRFYPERTSTDGGFFLLLQLHGTFNRNWGTVSLDA